MTPDDRSKLARIAAWQEFTGHTQAQIEAYLHSVASGLTQEQVNRAISEGRLGLGIASILNNPMPQSGFVLAATADGQPVSGYSMVVRYQTGANVETDWRTVTLTVPAGSTFGQTLGSIEAAISGQVVNKGYGRFAPGGNPQAPSIVFAVPVFTTG